MSTQGDLKFHVFDTHEMKQYFDTYMPMIWLIKCQKWMKYLEHIISFVRHNDLTQ